MSVLDAFSPAAAAWFSTTFVEPTPPQTQGWPKIAAGDHTLILAPTGSGKTLTAFFWGLDRLSSQPPPDDRSRRTRILYISPLRALAVDVEKNLRAPLQGIRLAADRLGETYHEPTVAMRTGDTPADERRRLGKHPPDLLITTPESLYLMLTSQVRETLLGVETVIIDEIHALAATKRGAHLALTLERLEHLVSYGLPGQNSAEARPVDDPSDEDDRADVARAGSEPTGNKSSRRDQPAFQRIGLSATQRPLEEIARFLGGYAPGVDGSPGRARPVTIVDTGIAKELDIEVVVPVEDMAQLGEIVTDADAPELSGPAANQMPRRSIWPSMHPRLLELVEQHRSTIVFVNARRLAERLATRLNELALSGGDSSNPGGANPGGDSPGGDGAGLGGGANAVPTGAEAFGSSPSPGEEVVLAHHGSLSREQRLGIEDRLKRGDLKGLVATSSLELGIDMGAVDLVIQVESPGAVSRGLQRVGRAGHQVGAPSRAKFFPKHRSDLLEAAVVVERMEAGLIEETRYPRNPLDVVAQQIVAACALDDWSVVDLTAMIRSAANYVELSDDALHNVLDLLAGRYPSDEFAELRPRIIWDRVDGVVRGRPGAQHLAVTSGGTIPDRGLYGVFLPDGTRVGELDEEMVYEARPGETFLLGASTWRIEDITHERVVVTPAPGQPGKMPFWRGDGPGRPLELGRAMGAFVREVAAVPRAEALTRLQDRHRLDTLAAHNLLAFLDEQREATGRLPDDRTILVERFRDEIGDWRICVLSPFGAQVHAPWGMALQHRLAERWGWDVELMWSDDGIVIRLPEAIDELPTEDLLIDPDEFDELLMAQLPQSAMFAARFRECAARALLLPRRRPDRRTPLWQQRQKAADLLAVAAKYPSFPMLLEASRECVNDVFDVPALRQVLTELRSRKIKLVPVDTPSASPFAQSLLFGWIAQYMYEGDAPLAERRAAALSLDRDLLRDLLGAEELRELLDPEVLAALEAELQRTAPDWRAKNVDGVEDLVRWLGPLTTEEIEARTIEGFDAEAAIAQLLDERRIMSVFEGRVAAVEDASRLRDALGAALPPGLPAAFTDSADDPLLDLVSRFARTHGPFLTAEVVAALGAEEYRVAETLQELERQGRVVRGEFRPDGVEREWCQADVLRTLRRRSLAALRSEVEPVEPDVLARFVPQWQHVGSKLRRIDGLTEVITALQGAALPASTIETDILPARLAQYSPADLDTLLTAGEVVWVGAGSIGSGDGRIRLVWRDQVTALVPELGGLTGSTGPSGSPGSAGTVDDMIATDVAAAADGGRPAEPIHDALRAHLAQRGASFWPDLVAAAQVAGCDYEDRAVLTAIWDLVWAGELTNDSFTPLRALVAGATPTKPSGSKRSRGRGRGRAARPNLRSLSRIGPPAGTGRWALVSELGAGLPVTPTEAATSRALQLLERYGVLTREMALAEGAEGGFAGVYPILKEMEERGQVRRGYFVAGLGAAQFALPGAVDRLRDLRRTDQHLTEADTDPFAAWDAPDSGAEPGHQTGYPAPGRATGWADGRANERDGRDPDLLTLSAVDPAQIHGAAVPWPEVEGRPARATGAYVVQRLGRPLAYLHKGAKSLIVFEEGVDDTSWTGELIELVNQGRLSSIDVQKLNGASATEFPDLQEALFHAGFKPGYRGPVYRR